MAGKREEILARPLARKNLKAMAAGGQDTALNWLQNGLDTGAAVEEMADSHGRPLLLVAGQSQTSRHDPEKEARLWFERVRQETPPEFFGKAKANRLALFGFGSPWPALLVLEEQKALIVYEPDPLVALSLLSLYDFSQALAEPKTGLTILTPWHLAENRLLGIEQTHLLVHPPAQRRSPTQLSSLMEAMAGRCGDLRALSGRSLKIMVIPPISGGSLPVAASLVRAVAASAHQLYYLDWGPSIRQMEVEAHQAKAGEAMRLTAKIFEQTGPTAGKAMRSFRPDLVLALAQAPLDAAALRRLRESGQALMAFWLVEDFRYFGYVPDVAPAYDAFFHIQPGLIEPALKSWGLARAWYVPLAADPHLFQPLSDEGAALNQYRADLSFMGAGYPNRRQLIEKLAENYWPATGRPAEYFRIFGSGWSGVSARTRQHLLEEGRRVSLPECAMIYAGGRINLNIHSSFKSNPVFNQDGVFVNPRTFEIAAAGSFQIVDQRPLLPELFTNGRELAVAESYDHLTALIDHYLAHPEETAQMGRAARRRVLAEHTYGHRLEKMLTCLGWRTEAVR